MEKVSGYDIYIYTIANKNFATFNDQQKFGSGPTLLFEYLRIMQYAW